MRQLDLFGSFSETPSPETSPEEKAVVSKKKEDSSSYPVGPSYSKNALRSERLATAEVSMVENSSQQVDNQKATIPTTSVSASTSPLLLSLFDAPLTNETKLKETETKLAIDTELASPVGEESVENSQVKNSQVVTVSEHTTLLVEEQLEQINDVELAELVTVHETEQLIVEEPLETTEALIVSEPVVELKRKTAAPKQKKQLLPELKTNGSVIFDDGKISVKLKSSSPFPAPISKEKKERVKRPLQKRGRKSFKEIDAEVDLIEIPEDEILFQKQYYGISEVAKWFRVNTSLLRFWENEFDVLKPRKNRKGDRLFRPEDVKNLQLIYQLLRQRKYTIEGAKEYIKTNKKKADIQLHLTNTLQKFKNFLLDLKANLQP